MNDIAQVYPVETSLQSANPRKLMTGEPEIASEARTEAKYQSRCCGNDAFSVIMAL